MIENKKEGDSMSFSIGIYRKKAGLTQAGLGEKLGVSAQTVWRWENGSRQPDIGTAVRIAEILKCTLDELIAPNPTKPRPKRKDRSAGRKPGWFARMMAS